MIDESYSRQVDRRLSAATMLILLLEDKNKISMPYQQSAVIESSLMQCYFAIFSYLNELLSYHQRKPLEISTINLLSILEDKGNNFLGINEFNLLKEWSQRNGNILNGLASLPDKLTMLADITVQKMTSESNQLKNKYTQNGVRLISVNNVSELENVEKKEINLFEVSELKKTILSLQSFIESQRKFHDEY